jgi:hypothetical protein
MPTRTKERFKVAIQISPELEAAAADLSALEVQMADDKLACEGGRRVSEWSWETETEPAWVFESRVAELQAKIGEPWDDSDPDDLVTAEDVERGRARGPNRYRIGSCWAVRA